jgi:hypothetical protein
MSVMERCLEDTNWGKRVWHVHVYHQMALSKFGRLSNLNCTEGGHPVFR